MGTSDASWEVTLLRRRPGARRPRVAGRVVIEAGDPEEARRMANAAMLKRAEDPSRWSLGVLRPLTPSAPGTFRYRISFAQWKPQGDHFERRPVHEMTLWACDASSARRLAQQEIQRHEDYEPSWRISSVARTAAED